VAATEDTSQANPPDLSHIIQPLQQFAVPIDSLVLDAGNARVHDERSIAAIHGSLKDFGQRLPIIVQKEGLVVRVGNGRVTAARQLGWTHIAALVVDESDVDSVRYALTDNRTAELADWDIENLLEALKRVTGKMDLLAEDLDKTFQCVSTMWSADELADIQGASLDTPEKVWQGMPEFDAGDNISARKIIVHFKKASDAIGFSICIGQQITERTRSIWYPLEEPTPSPTLLAEEEEWL